MILDDILAATRQNLEQRKQSQPQAALYQQIERLPATKGFRQALSASRTVKIIAEFKQASPSKGVIRIDLTPEEVFLAYEANGAAAISVLTEPKYFKGRIEFLALARRLTSLPLLRKDFILDEYQLVEARAYGADAVLLIVAALTPQQLTNLLLQAQKLSLDCVVEAHTKAELDVALDSGAQIIGINNRNLYTFETSLETTAELANYIPQGRIVVSESGINTKADINRLAACGVNAVLIGEALMRNPSPGQMLRQLVGDAI